MNRMIRTHTSIAVKDLTDGGTSPRASLGGLEITSSASVLTPVVKYERNEHGSGGVGQPCHPTIQRIVVEVIQADLRSTLPSS